MTWQALSFHDLYERYAPEVYRFSFWLAGNAADADDITAETFVRAWTSRNRIRTETVKAYLFTIARNFYLQMGRTAQRELSLEAAATASTPAPNQVVENKQALETAVSLLQSLPETDRTALVLRAQHELPYAEIARILEISESSAKVKVHRARLRLTTLRELKESI